jgi:16S rRNA (adenine1518-N6/adenine1519-N6)-dimethyltransferase
MATDVRVHRAVSRTVFHPVPNVDSVLVVLRRTGPAPDLATRRLVQQAFAHRRKALPGSLALTPGAPEGVRDAARAALEKLGHPPDARAERLSPEDFRRLAEALA